MVDKTFTDFQTKITADWLNFINNEVNALGTASKKDVETDGGTVVESGDIGTAARAYTGTDATQVPTNDDIDSRGFAEAVDSVADLRAGSFPANLERLWLSGYSEQGTPGSGEFYRAGSGFTSADDDGRNDIVDNDGALWRRVKVSALNESPESRELAFRTMPKGQTLPWSSDTLLDALNWEPHWLSPVVPAGGGDWRDSKASSGAMSFLFIGGNWQLYLSGQNSSGVAQIGLMKSRGTGLDFWSDEGAVLSPSGSGWDSGDVGGPCVLNRLGSAGTNLIMFYSAHDGSQPSGNKIGIAFSPDGGFTWNKSSQNPVLEGTAGEWDENGVQSASVIWDEVNQEWIMAYSGWNTADVTQGQIGIATSPDLINWTKHASNPVLTYGAAGDGDDYGLLSPTLWKEEGTYYVGYAGKRADVQSGEPFEISSICIASGSNFDSLTKSANNPIIDARDYAAYTEIECPQFIRIGETWHAFAETFVEDANVQMFIAG